MKKLMALVISLVLVLSAFAGVAVAEDKPLIGLVIISGTNPHCMLFVEGFEEVCEKYGAETVILDADYDPAALMNALSEFVSMGCDGIVVEACDAEAPIQGIREAHEAGIIVAASDMILPITEEDGWVISQTVSDNYKGGYMCGEDVVKRANGEEFNVCIMDMPLNGAAVQRIQGFKDAIAGNDNIKILSEDTPTPETLEQKMAICDAWIQKYDKIDAIFAFHDPAGMACVSSLKAAGRLEETLIYGIDGNEDAIQAIAKGEFTATAKQDPHALAVGATEDLFTVLNGGTIEHDFMTYVPVTYIDATNAAEFLAG